MGLAATHFVEKMLFELEPNDPLTIALALLFWHCY